METVLGKACSFEGKFGDATPFSSNSVDVAESICDRLQVHGFERHGNEQLMNGMTGEMIDAQVFFGPVYYQRLKHMVSDKLHSRSQGQYGRSNIKNIASLIFLGNTNKLREHLVKSLILIYYRNIVMVLVNH